MNFDITPGSNYNVGCKHFLKKFNHLVIFFTIVAIYLKERNFQGQNTENKGKSAHFQQNSSNVP